MNKWLAIGGDV